MHSRAARPGLLQSARLERVPSPADTAENAEKKRKAEIRFASSFILHPSSFPLHPSSFPNVGNVRSVPLALQPGCAPARRGLYSFLWPGGGRFATLVGLDAGGVRRNCWRRGSTAPWSSNRNRNQQPVEVLCAVSTPKKEVPAGKISSMFPMRCRSAADPLGARNAPRSRSTSERVADVCSRGSRGRGQADSIPLF